MVGCAGKANDEVTRTLKSLSPPILIVSTAAGRGIYSVGEAIREMITHTDQIYHSVIEDMLPENALKEDYRRYNLISNKYPFLLNLVYRLPVFYYRKLFREKYVRVSDMTLIRKKIDSLRIKTVVCASHRPAFWFSNLKYQEKKDFRLWGMLSEFGRNLGWKYIFWETMDGYFSPVERRMLDFPFPGRMQYVKANPLCKQSYYSLAQTKGDKNKVLFVTGHWGQVFIKKAQAILEDLLQGFPNIRVIVVCGKNEKLFKSLSSYAQDNQRVGVHGEVESLSELMKECASIITKPGISTLLEAHAAERKIFLIRGLPVAEDNNARYAIEHFSADWFKIGKFKGWYHSSAL